MTRTFKCAIVFAVLAGITLGGHVPAAMADGFTLLPAQHPPSITTYQLQPFPTTIPSFFQVLSGTGLNTVINQSTNTLTLSGNVTNPGAAFGYIVGTSPSSNPAIGLDLNGAGAVTYDYSMPMTVEHQAPTVALPGQTVTLDPFLSLNGAPTLSASQTIDFGTDLFFGFDIDMPWFIPDISVHVDDLAIPNVSYAGVTLTTNGSGSISTGNSTYIERPQDGPGYFTATTGENSMNAWSVSADLIALAAELGVTGMSATDALGFDLDLSLGMPIYREDAFALYDYSFSPVTFTVPEDAQVGQILTYEVNATLSYDLFFQSRYDYGGSLAMDFDGPFFDPLNIFNLDLGQFDVGQADYLVAGLTMPVTISGQTTITDPSSCQDIPTRGIVCTSPYLVEWTPGLPPGMGAVAPPSGAATELAYPSVASDEFVEYYQATVPEPMSLLLLGTGLTLADVWMRKKRRR